MKIKYLGTGAFEGVPALFCDCEVCKKARRLDGRNVRSRSQALINDELLIDFNADTCMHSQRYGFSLANIRACLITHAHCDHLYPDDVEAAGEPFSHDHRPIRFFAPDDCREKLKPFVGKTNGGAVAFTVSHGKRFDIDGKYNVLPFRANHDKTLDCLFYSIECEGKRLLYAHDTGVFFEDVWQSLKTEKRFDLVSLDCTGCLGLNGEWRDGHMSLKTNVETVERLKSEGLVDADTRIVLNHFSHNGGQVYDEMIAAAEEYGFTVAYDGAEFEF